MSYKGTYEGKSLKHYRTKGSRNGYSKDPNYTPIGEKAQYNLGNAVKSLGRGIFKKPSADRKDLNYAPISEKTQPQVPYTGGDFHPRSTQRDFDNVVNTTRSQLNVTGPTTPLGRAVALNKLTAQNIARSNANYAPNARNSAVNAGMTAREQAASRRAGQANAIRSNQKAAEQRRIAGGGMTASQIATKRSSQAARDAETKRQNLRTGESQVMANRRSPVSDARNVQGNANSARAAVENRRTAESKKAYYQRELEKSKKVSSARNSRSDVQNAVADAKSDAKRLIKKGRKKVRNLLRKFF